MRQLLSGYFLIVSLGAFFSCSMKENNYAKFDSELRKIIPEDVLKKSQYCIVIPKAGCGGCIDQAIKFLKFELNNFSDTRIVFTGIEDVKRLRLDIGQDVLDSENVYLDSAQSFQNIDLKSIYPQIFFLENGSVINIKELDMGSGLDMKKLLAK